MHGLDMARMSREMRFRAAGRQVQPGQPEALVLVTENLRNLLADQNYVQKYSSVPTERQAKRSVWIALLMIRAKSALDVWWQISGIFGGGILGLFLLALLRVRLRLWQGLLSIAVSVAVISWGTFARNLPARWEWAQCTFDLIITGTVGTAALMVVALVLGLLGGSSRSIESNA